MSVNSLNALGLLGFGPAPTPTGTQPNPTAQLVQMVGMFALMGVIFYFMLIRPQRTRAKQHDALMAQLKPGDKVVPSGGVIGQVITVKDKTVTLRSADTKMEVLKSAISEVIERAGATSQSNS